MDDALAADATNGPGERTKTGRKRAPLDREVFDALLAALHTDRNEAAQRYEALRDRLRRFFTWNHAPDPDALADEALDRLARRAADEGKNEAVRQPEKFAAGIARLMLREVWRRQKADARLSTSLQEQAVTLPRRHQETREAEVAAHFLDGCLGKLAPTHRDLIQRYYSTASREQIDARKTMAREQGISLNTLRNRALRIRQDLEDCVKSSLARNLQ